MSGNRLLRVLPLILLCTAAPAAHAASVPVVATIPPLSVSADPDRTFVDIPLAAPAAAPAALTVCFADPVPAAAVRAVTLHLRCGTGWRTATLPAERAHGNVRLPFGAFSAVEGILGPAEKADLVRISLWRRALRTDTPPVGVEFAGLTPCADIAVVRATEDTAPGETAFAGRMADRLERLLSRANVPFDTLLDTDLPEGEGAASRTFLFLPYAPSLSPARLAALRAHVAAGGRVVAFYNASPALSELIGLAPPRYRNASPGWTAMSWNGRRIPHATEHLLVPVVKDPAATTVAATWIDADGKDTKLPAIAVTRHGALFAHVPPLAYPAAQDLLLLAIIGSAVPPAGPVPATPQPPPKAGSKPEPREAGSVPEASASGSVVGAWVASPRLPAATPPALNTLFAYLAAAQAAPADRRSAVHVWLPLLDPVDVPGHRWLDPAVSADRAAALRRVRAAARLRPAGIHFDYVRSRDGAAASPEAAAAVTSLLREAAAIVRELAPSAAISAAVFPTPAAATTVNQDWPAWIKEGLVNFVCPMIYEDDPDAFRAALVQCLAAAPADRLVAGIGTGADEAQVDMSAFRDEVAAAAAAHLRGVAFFALDDALLELLPELPAADRP